MKLRASYLIAAQTNYNYFSPYNPRFFKFNKWRSVVYCETPQQEKVTTKQHSSLEATVSYNTGKYKVLTYLRNIANGPDQSVWATTLTTGESECDTTQGQRFSCPSRPAQLWDSPSLSLYFYPCSKSCHE